MVGFLGHNVVAIRVEPSAPTGEGIVYVAADGSEWRQRPCTSMEAPSRIGTGEQLAVTDGFTITEIAEP